MSMSSKMENFFSLSPLSEESSPLESVELSSRFDLDDDLDLEAVEDRVQSVAELLRLHEWASCMAQRLMGKRPSPLLDAPDA